MEGFLTPEPETLMGYNRSGTTRKKRLRRHKKHVEQLERKAANQATATAAQPQKK
jgi:hypothetical protein